MKVLMIGDADSLWMQRYIKYVSLPLGHQVEIISNNNRKYAEFYRENNIQVHTAFRENNVLFKVPKLRGKMISRETKRLISEVKADVVQVQFVNTGIADILAHSSLDSKLILTYWGSDLLRGKKEQLIKVKPTIEKADSVVVMTDEMQDKFLDLYGNEFAGKTQIIDMGVSAFKSIDEAVKDKAEAKRKLIGKGNAEKTVITLGYNASEGQQHEKLMAELRKLPAELKEKICVVLPMTYPDSKATYVKSIQQLAESEEYQTAVLTEFMNDEQIAVLCAATDIFVNAQITDALSTSMMEQLYSGSLVFNGSWLHYSFLDKLGIYYENFDDIGNISERIKETAGDFKTDRTAPNHDLLAGQCSWASCKERWEKVYKQLIS